MAVCSRIAQGIAPKRPRICKPVAVALAVAVAVAVALPCAVLKAGLHSFPSEASSFVVVVAVAVAVVVAVYGVIVRSFRR